VSIWIVKIASKAENELVVAIKNKEITADDQEVIKTWIEEIQEEGIESIKDSKFWNDHALDGRWTGHRSSSFSNLGRIIYRIEDKKVIVEVVRITADHDYSKED